MTRPKEAISLPVPRADSACSVERALSERHSIREFGSTALALADVSQLLWAAQGVTGEGGSRTAPSAGALYPLEVYLVLGNVQQLATGVYKYEAAQHRLARIAQKDEREALARAAYNQDWLRESAAVLAVTGVDQRTTGKYGERGVRYVHMEAGHAAQNVLLQAVALNVCAAAVGAFDDDEVNMILSLPKGERPLYLLPLGRRA
jgi:SagB-type dehydrogenase family enzyme